MVAKKNSGSFDIGRLVDQASIENVAERIGLQIDTRKRQPRRAICPFHDDRDPSLNLYRGGGSTERDHYHCYVCGAHGDAVSLIQNIQNVSFWDAIKKLAEIEGVEIGSSQRPAIDRASGATILVQSLHNQSKSDEKFLAFARDRGFDPEFLRSRGAAKANLNDLISRSRTDRAVEEQLVEAGIIRREDQGEPTSDLFGTRLRGFYQGNRIVFPIDGPKGDPVGFAARALDDQKAKYLYSYDFPRRTTLYGEGRLLKKVREMRESGRRTELTIYLVEGIFDVLRLEQLGFHALGVLGSHLTPGQVERLAYIQQQVSDADGDLHFHVFFDWDDAGRRGAYDATLHLLKLLQTGHPFDLKVLSSSSDDTTKIDPDNLLRDAAAEEAGGILATATTGPIEYLAAFRLGANPHAIDWEGTNRLRLASIARSIVYSLREANWTHILATLQFPKEAEGLRGFVDLLLNYCGSADTHPAFGQQENQFREPADSRSDLLTALTLGRSSTARREYPLDDEAWERLAIGASPFFHIHWERLSTADGPSSPLLARHIPKGGGKYRLKSGPVARDAILQQYALMELLRDRDDCPRFAESVPAVRFVRDSDVDGGIHKTGRKGKEQALSFAYQIDMAIVNGLAPPKREGIFRPYFECWRSFIDFLEDRIKNFRYTEMQILRLDITGFYDNIKSDIFGDALAGPLEKALHSLNFSDGGIGSFAPLLSPSKNTEAAERSEAFTEFLLNHSFGLRYFDPVSGAETSSDAKRGIPQGPDLSAYLANISLFDLDEMMAAEIDKLNATDAELKDESPPKQVSAAYARYVDDLVIVCKDFETAAQFRRKIESFIALKGLSLNRKNVTPPPMTRAEARNWITDNRAGFGFSGPLADLPTTEAMDPLADAGEIDRRTALGLLFDPELDNPENIQEGVAKIGLALSAQDIRFSDRANAYKRLWCFAADTVVSGSGADLATTFSELLTKAEPQCAIVSSDTEKFDIAMAALEGLERACRAIVPDDTFSEELRSRIEKNMQRLAASIIGNPFSRFANELLGEASSRFLTRFDTRCQIGLIACLAAEKLTSSNTVVSFEKLHEFLLPKIHQTAPLPEGLLNSLLKYDSAYETKVPPLVVANDQSVSAAFSRLNQTLVQLQRAAAIGVEEGPPAFPPPELLDPNPIVRIAQSIMAVWAPAGEVGSDAAPPSNIELDAAATLVNVTYPIFGQIVAARPKLTRMISGSQNVTPLPSPPGLETSGLLLHCADGSLLLASPVGDNSEPAGVTWSVAPNPEIPGIALRKASLPKGSQLLVDREKWSPSEIAALYKAGFPIFMRQRGQETDRVPVPTAFSFFARVDGDKIDFGTLQLISWTAPRSSVDGHAFVRVGRSLEARSVFSDGADLWRYGWAVRDACHRAEPSQDDESGMDHQAGVLLDKEFHRREAIITRVLPRLSGADRWGPGEGTPEEPIPTRIRRALKLLENFDRSKTASEAASCLVAAVSEGMFMSERVNALHDLTSSGDPAELLARATKRVSRALPEAAKHWDDVKPLSLPRRRSAAAWQTLSHAIKNSREELPSDLAQPLVALETGAETLAAVADLRALAFEIAAGLPEESIERLVEVDFDLSWISEIAGLDLVMIDDGSARDEPALQSQTLRLVRAFCHVVLGKSRGLNYIRDRITPAGWTVMVAILLQIVPARQSVGFVRPHLWQARSGFVKAEAALKQLLQFFASSSAGNTNAPNWPWDIFEQLYLQRPADVPSLLRDITDASAIVVQNEISWSNPRTGENQSDRPIIRLADGSSISLSEWQIDVTFVRGERGTGMEAYPEGSRLRFPYSISRYGDQVLGLHLVSSKLGKAAFGHPGSFPGKQQADQKTDPTEQIGLEATEISREAFKNNDGNVEQFNADAQENQERKLTGDALDALTEERESIAFIRSKRLASWRARSADKNHGTHRVALVQWDVTDSYYSPGHNAGLYEGLLDNSGSEPAAVGSVRRGGVFLSASEHRRRKLIREVLNACSEFDVDGLIFPEYSLRPETINWLARQLRTHPHELTVWCGTFRVPNASQLDLEGPGSQTPYSAPVAGPLTSMTSRWEAHTAVLTCLRSNINGSMRSVEHFARQKRYPSAAAGELIRPPFDKPWSPLLVDEIRPLNLGTFALELVCSEMFPHASSANFVGIIQENNELATRYGMDKGGESMFNHISNDIYEFARWTAFRNAARVVGDADKALTRGDALQRTFIVLPAMTSRSADYHIFGQNQYLAAGLVTAFCNAVVPHASCGQSGFIGLDGWKRTDGKKTPYGSKAPGIFQLNDSHSGPLGEKESAMVIADLDLLRTTDQRPRPHYQPRSLELVAHLPIFFATEKGDRGGIGSYPNKQRQLRTRLVAGKGFVFEDALIFVAKALSVESDWKSNLNVASHDQEPPSSYTEAIAATLDALRVLEDFADDSYWLKKRTASFELERDEVPPMSPLPALIDWLYVDDRWSPEDYSANGQGDAEDSLTSDKPLLTVPRSTFDEATKKLP